jgi:hypothetical protein
MMKGVSLLIIFCLLFITPVLKAQKDTSFKSSGKVLIQVIDRTLYETDGNTEKYGMYINRAFFGYRYAFHQKWSGALVIDAGRPTIFGNLMVNDTSGNALPVSYDYSEGSFYTIMLKFAYLEFNPTSKLKLQAGGILQNHYITQEKFWGYRYILETFQDRYYRTPSSDLGFIAYYSPLDWLSVDAAITNGEGMRINQESFGNVKYAVGVDVKPFKSWVNRIYYDAAPSDNPTNQATRRLISFFTGYRLPGEFRIGAEYNYFWNYANIDENDLYGFSMFGSYEMKEWLEFFARYDNLKSNTLNGANDPWHLSKDGQAYIAGVHYVPVKHIALSLSYQGWKPDDNSLKFANTLALSFEFKL